MMINHHDNDDEHVAQDEPSKEIEERLKKDPDDPQAKTDRGSDESMDASDPVSSSLPGSGEPAPSSNAPKE